VLLFFFFQAEDGIRDFHVTGVQTCALPIFNRLSREQLVEWLAWNDVHGLFSDEDCIAEGLTPLSLEQARMCVYAVIMRNHTNWRSEERRVGKGIRYDLTREI